jgi:hypothetical protein
MKRPSENLTETRARVAGSETYRRRFTELAPSVLLGSDAVVSCNSKALTAVPCTKTGGQMGRNVFIVSRQHRDLYTYLRERFASDPAVEVVLDRRFGQRRQRQSPVDAERRRSDRRQRPEVEAELQTRSHAIITIEDLAGDLPL